jgi:putative addiction module component (TIGR02574 family)
MRPKETLRDEVLALPVPERARLARQILESLDGAPADQGADKAWADEIERRVEALDRGDAKTETAEVAFKKIEERRRRKKA